MPETKICKNCQKEFTITDEDLAFYEKIAVPAPTVCPDCRLQRRLAFRNERVLYSRKCDAPGHNESLITVFHPDAPYKVVDSTYWWSDQWDPMESGRDYDFGRPFFAQLLDLQRLIPRPSVSILRSENSDYANFVAGCKNCYQIVSAEDCEDCYYAQRVFYCKNCSDCENIHFCELCWECFHATKCYQCTSSQKLDNCRDVHFCYDCRGCSNCFGCVGLRNKSYYFLNKKCTEEEYIVKLKEAKLDSYEGRQKALEVTQKLHLNFPRRFAEILKSEKCTGDIISNCQNCQNSFVISEAKNVHHSFLTAQANNVMDANYADFCEEVYETMSSEHDSRKKFTVFSWESHDLEYCDSCHSGCANLFGCVGLSHKEYCILNKQYSREEYEKLVPKIIEQTKTIPYKDNSGREFRYGDFFPNEFATFAYNETVAQEYFPLDRESAVKAGFRWREPQNRAHQVTITSQDLPDTIDPVSPDILKDIIGCEHEGKCGDPCTHAFKIVEPELKFYKKMNLPLPHLCPICRHYGRSRLRMPLKLWERNCQCDGEKSTNDAYQNTVAHPHHGTSPCPSKFSTAYAPDRPEIVYCEECYLNEAA